jgi:hypothetical protein
MWFELMLIPFFVLNVLFLIFWIVQEGSRWQKHGLLGPFARFIQASALRAFIIFLVFTIALVPVTLGLMMGVWLDLLDSGHSIANTTPVVNTLLIMFLLMAMYIPVLWGAFGTWKQTVRSAAEVRVRTTSG